jgi:hypothetical protein
MKANYPWMRNHMHKHDGLRNLEPLGKSANWDFDKELRTKPKGKLPAAKSGRTLLKEQSKIAKRIARRGKAFYSKRWKRAATVADEVASGPLIPLTWTEKQSKPRKRKNR